MSASEATYCEAFPRLIGDEIIRAGRSDEPITLCRFATTTGQLRGWLQILPEQDVPFGLMARWRLMGPGLDCRVHQGIIPFRPTFPSRGRPSPFECPDCLRAVRNLVYRNRWTCMRCAGLRNRATLLKTDVRQAQRASDRMAELKQRVGEGRPPRMRHETYRQLRNELRRLQGSTSESDYLVANRNRSTVVISEWMSEEFAVHHAGFNPRIDLAGA